MTDEQDSTVRLQIGLPLDGSGYLRQECPVCMLEFKLKGEETRFTDVLSWWSSKAVAESGVAESHPAAATNVSQMTCPYCAHQAGPQQFFHAELQSLVVKVARREIVEPMLFSLFDEMERSFTRVRSSSMRIEVKQGSRARSPRPLAGPDADDMVRVSCASCDEHFKLLEGWSGSVTCPGCSLELRLI